MEAGLWGSTGVGRTAPLTAQISTFNNVTQGLEGNFRHILATYWQNLINEFENLPGDHDFKSQQVPLTRIKKCMRTVPQGIAMSKSIKSNCS
jgi:hypothetical protein